MKNNQGIHKKSSHSPSEIISEYSDILVYFLIFISFVVYLAIQIYSYQNFFSYNEGDKGVVYQLYYNTVVHGNFFYSSINGGLIDFSQSGRFIFLVFLPFFYVYPHPLTFSIISTFLLSIAALPVYWLASDASKSKKIGLFFVILYFLYPSISWLFLESVKEEIFVLPFLLFAFYYMNKKSFNKYVFFLFLAGICKISVPFILIMFGIYAFLEKYEKKWIISPILLGLGILITETFLLKPYFLHLSNELYGYIPPASSQILSSFTAGRLEYLGGSPVDIILNVFLNPANLATHLFTGENISYIFLLLLPVCFIGLIKPKILLIGLPVLLGNLLSISPAQRMITWHYVSILVFVVLCASIFAFPLIYEKLNRYTKILFICLLLISSISTFILFGAANDTINHIQSPDGGYYGQFNTLGITADNRATFFEVINKIPENSSIYCDLEFGPYVYKNNNVYYYSWSDKSFTEEYDYYLLKKSPDLMNFNNYKIFQNMTTNGKFEIKYYDGANIILQKNNASVSSINTNILTKRFFRSQESVSTVHYDESVAHNIIFSSKTDNKPGYLIYGPYINLQEGNYTIHYRIKYNNVTNVRETIASLDIFSSYTNSTPLVWDIDEKVDLYASNISENTYNLVNLTVNVENNNDNRLFEFRIFQPGNSDLSVENVMIEAI